MKVEMPVPCLRMHEDWYPECDKLLESVIGAAEKEYSICPWMRSRVAAQTGNVDAFDYRSSVQCSLQDILVSSDPDFAEVRRSVEHFTLRIDELIRDYNESYETGMPLEWIRVHDLPQYAYFDHSAHVNRGVSCVECHGRIDTMEVVYQHETLSMGWCLSCHRNPEPHIRNPKLVTQLDWGIDLTEADRITEGSHWIDVNHLNPSEDCSTCHR